MNKKLKIILALMLVLVLGFILVFIACSPQEEETVADQTAGSPLAYDIPALPRFRVVWVQDTGDGGDVNARGSALRLMGMDTADGNGERAILGSLGNYVKPLITPRGDRVVYSDWLQKKIFVVNWDGSGRRVLSDGFGLALWQDPGDGREWLYYGHEEMMEGGFHCRAVYRKTLENPGEGELVWDKAPVNIDSFRLSTDGRMAGGNMPWPDGGVAHLPNGSLEIFTRGCWADLTTAGGKSYYWIFDGAHRNLTFFSLPEKKRWQVRINGAPGIEGHEVYHPRWSNHPRIMAMTGPYKVGSGGNRIEAGGREVEIYVGRFNADLTNIEFWWKITDNDRGDFYPDIWVAPAESGEGTGVKVRAAEMTPTVVLPTAVPGKTEGCLAVEARLIDISAIPSPQDIAPYRRALLVNGYEVLKILSGDYQGKKIMVAHWVIEDGQVLEKATRVKGQTYQMVLERYDDHPELEGERLVMDSDEFKLPLYVEQDR
ncbi:MAG: hypothetical protein FWE89_03870 [Syntrophaceae bacterium]|nr:hypothetical protein [Syntrophaceae bacterium]